LAVFSGFSGRHASAIKAIENKNNIEKKSFFIMLEF
jgi:hypothetical protein